MFAPLPCFLSPPDRSLLRRLAHIDHVRADSNRVFELRIYHTVPGKLPALESRFRDIYSKLLAKHDLQVVGYWVPEGAADWDNTFVYLVAHSSREEAKKNWDAMLADPEVRGGNQIRAGQQAGGKDRPNVHAVDGFFAEVVSHFARFDSLVEFDARSLPLGLATFNYDFVINDKVTNSGLDTDGAQNRWGVEDIVRYLDDLLMIQ